MGKDEFSTSPASKKLRTSSSAKRPQSVDGRRDTSTITSSLAREEVREEISFLTQHLAGGDPVGALQNEVLLRSWLLQQQVCSPSHVTSRFTSSQVASEAEDAVQSASVHEALQLNHLVESLCHALTPSQAQSIQSPPPEVILQSNAMRATVEGLRRGGMFSTEVSLPAQTTFGPESMASGERLTGLLGPSFEVQHFFDCFAARQGSPTRSLLVPSTLSRATLLPELDGAKYEPDAPKDSASAFSVSQPHGRVVPLSLPTDRNYVTEYQVLLREQIDLFEATEMDLTARAQGRNKPIQLKSVGIRCRHCSCLHAGFRPRGAVYFPTKLIGIYHSSQNMAVNHFASGSCKNTPGSVMQQLTELRESKNHVYGRSSQNYWKQAAIRMGVREADGRLVFTPDCEATEYDV